jgi:hypothetical protein
MAAISGGSPRTSIHPNASANRPLTAFGHGGRGRKAGEGKHATDVPATVRRGSMVRTLALLGLTLGCSTGEVLAGPCEGFTDVDASSPFCTHVAWVKNRGITLGCTSTLYCPNDAVTRLQMAIFLYRFGNVVHQQGGNAFGATSVIGTTDAQAHEVIVGGSRVMRFEPNATSPNLIGGHPLNAIAPGVRGGTISGGGVQPSTDPDFTNEFPNQVTDAYGTIGGGFTNVAGNGAAVTTDAPWATVGGGANNGAQGKASTVGGGSYNDANGHASTVGGGFGNAALNDYVTVAGGNVNAATGHTATIGGGSTNRAQGFGSTVPGGISNEAMANYSFAAGYRAKATTVGTFMWADSTNVDWIPSVPNFFGVRATGGVGMTVAVNGAGAATQFCNYLPGYSGWSCTSDRDAKENFVVADTDRILAKLVAMPMFSWNYKGADPTLRMLGPTSQDFDAAFGLGNADKTIASGNLHGVAIAAI